MTSATQTATTAEQTWTPVAGKRATWLTGADATQCTILHIYKGGTATIRYVGRACLEGKIVTQRGISLRSLSAPRSVLSAFVRGEGK